MDFTLKIYKQLLTALLKGGFNFQTFREFIITPADRVVVLRHDVDLLPGNSLVTAKIEHGLGVRGSYYFRIVPESFDESVIKGVYALGHEVGYHYENMDIVGRRTRVDKTTQFTREDHIDAAWDDFKRNLNLFRKLVPVETVAMHGSPRSRFNNLDVWDKYDFRELGIIGEPYLNIDFSDVFYLTDTGRRWDGASVSVRDKVASGFSGPEFVFQSTSEIIAAAEQGRLPSRIMINIHPQRWSDLFIPWIREFAWQNIKNWVKRYLIIYNS